MAVAAQGDVQRPPRLPAQGVQDRDVGRHAVGPDHRVPGEVRDGLGNAVPVEVGRRREEPERDAADMARHERVLARPCHAHRHVRLLAGEVGVGVGEEQFDREARVALAQDRQHRGTTSMPTKSETLRRTGPATSDAAPSASRRKASDAWAMRLTCPASPSASGVGASPFTPRTNSGCPMARSSVSTRCRMVGWVRPRARAAADRLPYQAQPGRRADRPRRSPRRSSNFDRRSVEARQFHLTLVRRIKAAAYGGTSRWERLWCWGRRAASVVR